MARYTVLDATPPYCTVEVQIGEAVFVQTLISSRQGAALEQQLQEYADAYEHNLLVVANTQTADVSVS
jgi:hypothetical protein